MKDTSVAVAAALEANAPQRAADEGDEASVSRGGENRIIVSIESEPNIERFARLILHDEEQDADDDMTPMVTEDDSDRSLHYHKKRSIREREVEGVKIPEKQEGSDGEDEEEQQGEVEEEEEEEDTLKQEIENERDEVQVNLCAIQDEDKSDCVSDIRTFSPDIEREMKPISKIDDQIIEQISVPENEKDHLNIDEEIRDINMDCVENVDTTISPVGYQIDSPVNEEIIAEEEAMSSQYEHLVLEIHEEIIKTKVPTVDALPNIAAVTSFLNSEKSDQLTHDEQESSVQHFIDNERSLIPPIITTEESSTINSSVVDEDISNYDNFITIMQSKVVKEVTKGPKFPIKHVNKLGDFPKTISELTELDEEDMTEHEKKNLKQRKRQDSIKVKILKENTDQFQQTGHHPRYNMPAHSVDMQVRIVLSNQKLEEDKKVFPRIKQIFIPGNFPREIQHEREYKLRDDPKIPVRVRRMTYTQPIAQLTMIREEPRSVLGPEFPLSSAPSSSNTTPSIPSTPDLLGPNFNQPLLLRSRSNSPYIHVDKDDPMMVLLKDTMEIPLVHDNNL